MESGNDVRERLIAAGIRELGEHGVAGFSLRRIAQACGVSCAAPYRHFRDKQALIDAVADAINRDWFERQSRALQAADGGVADQLRTVCKEYLRFLRDNPAFCALITQRDEDSGKWRLNRLSDRSSMTKRLIARYAQEYRMGAEEVYARVYAVRAMLYGAAMMNQYDDMRLTDASLAALERIIDAEIARRTPDESDPERGKEGLDSAGNL